MPLLALTADEAVSNRKNNPVAGWAGRGSPNRIEPVALPAFQAPFKIHPGAKIFTVGSCFARNVEAELFRRGFVVPMWELFKRPEFSNLNVQVVNNYGTPSIYNEIAWAFGERPFVPEQHLLEVIGGKFADIHLIPARKPEPWDVVLSRRNAIMQAYRTAAECEIVIMTLGLAELWFDTQTEYYLNVAPRPTFIDRFPGRFQLHVLNFQEAFDYLEKSILILRKHSPNLNVILTVSPVPLMATHRPIDVMVANTYSKSLLRTVAETIVAKYPFVAYFPSFESVTLSDRAVAWEDDMVHVTKEIVEINVGRMIEAYIESPETNEAIKDGVIAFEKAKAARARGPEYLRDFFTRHGEWSAKNRDFALEHARYLSMTGKASEALIILSGHDPTNMNVVIQKAQALVAMKQASEAMDLLEPFCERNAKSAILWDALLSAAMENGEEDKVNSILWRIRVAIAGRSARSYIRGARWMISHGKKERALDLAKGVMEEPLQNSSVLELTEILIDLNELPLARQAIELLASPRGAENIRMDQLKAFLGSHN